MTEALRRFEAGVSVYRTCARITFTVPARLKAPQRLNRS